MGSLYKRAIFNEHVQTNLVGWAKKAKKKKSNELKAEKRKKTADKTESPSYPMMREMNELEEGIVEEPSR